jgi:hypothetical protein
VQERVAEYDKANPGRSTRQAAADLGVSNKTVSLARGVTQVTPDTVTGRDGKTYPAKRPEYVTADDPRTSVAPPIQYKLLDQVKPAILQMNEPTRKALETWFREIHHGEIAF